MNLVTHIFKKDLRHLRSLLIVWGVLVVIQIGLGGSGLAASADNMAWEIAFGIVSFLLPMLQFLLVLTIVPLLIHDEPLVGTTAFWFTRPIARSDLLKSKGLFCIGLLVMIPLVIELAVLAINQVTPVQLMIAVPEILLERLGNLLMIAALAVLTPSFARFVLWAVVLFVIYIVVFFVIYIFNLFVDPSAMMNAYSRPTLIASRGVAASLIGIFGFGAVVVNQYLTRTTRRSIALLATVLALSMGTNHLWPWDFMKRTVVSDATADFDPSSVTLHTQGKHLQASDAFRMNTRKGVEKSINGTIRVSGGTPGFEYRPRVITASLTFEGGLVADKESNELQYNQHVWYRDDISHVMDGFRVLDQNINQVVSLNWVTMDEQDFLQASEQTAVLKASIEVDVYQYVITGSIPLKKNEGIYLGVEQAVITDILEDPTGCSVILRERSLNLKFDNVETPGQSIPGIKGSVLYLLRNVRMRECVLPSDDYSANINMMMNQAQRLTVGSERLKFGSSNTPGNKRARLDKEWLADAELVRLEAVKVGRFEKEMEAEGMRIDNRSGALVSVSRTQEEIEQALALITLPETPTREDVRTYIREIDKATEGQRRWRKKDTQVSMLKKVGSEHLDLLLEESKNTIYHLRHVVPSLVNESHKDLIISNLQEHPVLVQTVLDKKWTESAREILIDGLTSRPEEINVYWFKSVAAFKDPSTYKSLVDYFVNRDHSETSYNVLKNIDGIDLEDAVARAWKSAKYGYDHEIANMIPIALRHGNLDALQVAVRDFLAYPDEKNSHRTKQIRKVVKKHTGIDLPDAEFVAWYQQNKDQLVFDPETKMFQPKVK